jgi:hypothetical protein
MHSIRALMQGIIDYAGLFPPASLDMLPTVTNYAAYREADVAWALGRLIVPVTRLGEFEAAAQEFLPRDPQATAWPLSVLATSDLQADLTAIHAFNERHAVGTEQGTAEIDTIEIKAASCEEIIAAMKLLPTRLMAYFEIPITDDPTRLVQTIRQVGARAKVRTGGTSHDLFPTPSDLLRFIQACVTADVPFKATAGLHHALRSEYRLTYDRGGATGTMYGFLNVFLSTAFLGAGMDGDAAIQVLTEQAPTAFQFTNDGVSWRSWQINNQTLLKMRQQHAISFGSCSFEEPIEELKAMKLV